MKNENRYLVSNKSKKLVFSQHFTGESFQCHFLFFAIFGDCFNLSNYDPECNHTNHRSLMNIIFYCKTIRYDSYRGMWNDVVLRSRRNPCTFSPNLYTSRGWGNMGQLNENPANPNIPKDSINGWNDFLEQIIYCNSIKTLPPL